MDLRLHTKPIGQPCMFAMFAEIVPIHHACFRNPTLMQIEQLHEIRLRACLIGKLSNLFT